MATLNKTFGLTFPFRQGSETGYAKPQVNLTLKLDEPLGPQLERAAIASNVIDDFLIEVLERTSVRYLREYATNADGSDARPKDENGDELPWQFDPTDIRAMINTVLQKHGAPEDDLLK